MNYRAHYDKLIARGQRTLIHGYRERHHIVPKCMGGTDDEDNLVYLTAEEHYVAHQLLVKINPSNYKLIHAAHMMCIGSKNHIRNNKSYGWIRARVYETRRGKIRPKYECTICKKWVDAGNLKRYHNDNCNNYIATKTGRPGVPITINGICYTSKKEAAEMLNLHPATLAYKLKTQKELK